jgi:hypothetical protein
LDQTGFWADADLKRVLRLEVKYCERLEGDGSEVTYENHRPILKCAVPVEEVTCLAVIDPDI